MLSLPLASERWEEGGTTISVADGETIGRALQQIGRFNEAQPWYERAAKESEPGDVHGRVNQESLRVSIEALADCLRQLSRKD